MIRRVALAVGAALAMVPVAAGPARADDRLAVTVVAAKPGQVQLTAFVAAGAEAPMVTVSHQGTVLPSTVGVVQAAASPAQARAVVVVLDTGGPLAGAGLQAAEDAVLGFARAVPADVEIGLVAVADAPSVLVRPTRDREAIGAALPLVRAGGRSAVSGALGSGGLGSGGLGTAAGLVAGYADRRLLVVSDGQVPVSPDTAKALTAAGTPVDVVAFRPPPEGLDRLRRLAAATGGMLYPSADAGALAGALRTAAATFPLRLEIAVSVPAALAGSSGSLTVTAVVGGARYSAAVPVKFVGPAPPPAAAGTVFPRGAALLRPSLLAVLVFVALLASALLATAPLRRPVRAQRLSQVDKFRLPVRDAPSTGAPADAGSEGALARAVLGLSGRVVTLGGAEGRIASKLEKAGMAIRPREWIVLRACASVIAGMLLAPPGGPPGFVMGAALGWLGAGLYRRLRASRRRRAFAEQLPDALQLVVGSLKSGFSLAQAIDAVSRELPPGPLTAAFGRVMAETRIGADIGDALERAADRSDNEDLAWMVMAVRIQRDTGGNLAEVLQTTVDTLREREQLRGHVRALSAEGRLSAYILIALPIVLAGWMFLVRRDYLSVLWTTPAGLIMLVGAVALVVVGSIWMSRWVKVEV